MTALQPEVFDVYADKELHASACVFDWNKPVLITFTPAAPTREAFALNIFSKAKVNTIVVTCLSPNWYQYSQMDQAARAIRIVAKKFPRAVHYGSSMGGFGALFFSGGIEPDCVLAVAPQYSIDPTDSIGETRWIANLTRIEASGGLLEGGMGARLMQSGEIYIISDPFNDDQKHVEMFALNRRVNHVLVPFGGHGVLFSLAEMGLAREFAFAAIEGNPSVQEMRQAVRSRRTRSIAYLQGAMARRGLKGRSTEGLLRKALSALPPGESGHAIKLLVTAKKTGDQELIMSALRKTVDPLIQDGDQGVLVRIRDCAAQIKAEPEIDGLMADVDDWIQDAAIPEVRSIAKVNNTLRRYATYDPLRSDRVRTAVRILKWSGALDTVLLATLVKATLLGIRGQRDEAMSLLKTATPFVGGWHPFNMEVAKTAVLLGDEEMAIQFARRVYLRGAERLTACQFIAMRLEALGRLDEALEMNESGRSSATATDAQWTSFSLGKARCLKKLGRGPEVGVVVEEVLTRHPTNALALRMRPS